MSWFSTVAQVCIALAPPLAYSDQYISVVRKHNSSGFSIDICGVLLVANITRIWYWFGAQFQTALLIQSVLMILFQLALLYVCLLYKPRKVKAVPVTHEHGESGVEEEEQMLTTEGGAPEAAVGHRPGNLWAWRSFGSYIEFLGLYTALLGLSFLLLHSLSFYITLLGFLALGLEATLPIPQVLVNYAHKSTAGFRHSVLFFWAGGDLVKLIYYFLSSDVTIAFKACACFQLSIDVVLVGQTWYYRKQTARDMQQLAALSDRVEGVAGPEAALAVARREVEDDRRESDEEREVGGGGGRR